MKYLKSYNEESIWNVFKIGKSRLYDKSRNLRKRSPNVNPYRFSSKKIPSIKLVHEYNTVDSCESGGTFLKSGSGDVKFRNSVYSDELWFDAKPIFDRLHKIGSDLGYKVGTSVSSESLGVDSEIVDIIDFAFYEYRDSPLSGGIYPVFTLLYKLESGSALHQIIDIDILKQGTGDNIIDEVIKENFYELLDDNTITYVSNKKVYKNDTIYECVINFKSMSIDMISRLSQLLSITEKRLKDQNILLEMKSIHTNEDGGSDIKFACRKIKNK